MAQVAGRGFGLAAHIGVGIGQPCLDQGAHLARLPDDPRRARQMPEAENGVAADIGVRMARKLAADALGIAGGCASSGGSIDRAMGRCRSSSGSSRAMAAVMVGMVMRGI